MSLGMYISPKTGRSSLGLRLSGKLLIVLRILLCTCVGVDQLCTRMIDPAATNGLIHWILAWWLRGHCLSILLPRRFRHRRSVLSGMLIVVGVLIVPTFALSFLSLACPTKDTRRCRAATVLSLELVIHKVLHVSLLLRRILLLLRLLSEVCLLLRLLESLLKILVLVCSLLLLGLHLKNLLWSQAFNPETLRECAQDCALYPTLRR